MKQITRDLYTSGRVWLSLSHSFTMKSKDVEVELLKINGEFITLNAGALFVLSLWSTGNKTPKKFYIPEYKIEDLREILSMLYKLKSDEAYVRDGELTDIAKSSKLYYRITGSSESFIDLYLIENDFNGDKSINIAIEHNANSEVGIYSMYNSNVADIINIIPTPSEIVKYKQSAAELFYIQTLFGGSSFSPQTKTESSRKQSSVKESEPRTINTVDRTHINREKTNRNIAEVETPQVEKDSGKKSGYDYDQLLEDE